MSQQTCRPRRVRVAAGAFTLAELMVVVLIISVLIAILVPVLGRVRAKANDATAQNFINQLAGAFDRYYQDFKAYPGPLHNSEIWVTTAGFPVGAGRTFRQFTPGTLGGNAFATTPWLPNQITENENAVLGLLGGLKAVQNGANLDLVYEPSLVGSGAMSLNLQNPKRYEPYLSDAGKFLSWRTVDGKKTGAFSDESCPTIQDTIIPEFVDPYPDPMPILVLRARSGASASVNASNVSEQNNGVVNPAAASTTTIRKNPSQQYDLDQIIAYTASYNDAGAMQTPPDAYPNGYPRSIGVGKKVPTYYENNMVKSVSAPYHGLRTVGIPNTGVTAPLTPGANYFYPLPAFPYLQNPQIPFTPRQKDGYILIAAGSDRMYGTNDDIVSFGSVQP